eukprot:jgi/Chrzof1/14991/Cz09g23130.t1
MDYMSRYKANNIYTCLVTRRSSCAELTIVDTVTTDASHMLIAALVPIRKVHQSLPQLYEFAMMLYTVYGT